MLFNVVGREASKPSLQRAAQATSKIGRGRRQRPPRLLLSQLMSSLSVAQQSSPLSRTPLGRLCPADHTSAVQAISKIHYLPVVELGLMPTEISTATITFGSPATPTRLSSAPSPARGNGVRSIV